ncbi:MAG: hypothetical protein K2K87_00335 [Lachnospiraceae bacterium]|nr:hypothetical protein [Lachnospiraceae bacterium]
MSETWNTSCAVCGRRYHICNACQKLKAAKSWRTVTDTMECYQIYLIVHEYTNGTITGEQARELLKSCVLPAEMQRHIKSVIDEILRFGKPDSTETDIMPDAGKTK